MHSQAIHAHGGPSKVRESQPSKDWIGYCCSGAGLFFPYLNKWKGFAGVLDLTSVLLCSHHGMRAGRDNSEPPGDP